MLANKLPVLDVIQDLMALPEPFYLTGSRHFGGVSTNSDWDFMAESTTQLRDKLFSMGFDVNEESHYSDDLSVSMVLYKYSHDRIEQKTVKVEVQLVKNLRYKVLIQEALKRQFPCGLPTEKDVGRKIWAAAYAAANAVIQTLEASMLLDGGVGEFEKHIHFHPKN